MTPSTRVLVLSLFLAVAWPQENAPVAVRPSPVQGLVNKEPATFELIPRAPGARKGNIWIRTTETGLAIEGELDGGPPDWPSNRAALLSKDHVEVWLAASPDVALPPIGWGDQFQQHTLGSASDCEKELHDSSPKDIPNCEQWYAEQVKYRLLLKRLIVRQWLFAWGMPPKTPWGEVVESYATPAYQDLVNGFFSEYVPPSLEPAKKWPIHFASSRAPGLGDPNEKGYSFDIQIPYSAFPPLNQLKLQDLWIMVDVFSPSADGQKTGPFSTTSWNREWGNVSTFNQIRLTPAKEFSLTPCHIPLRERDIYEDQHLAWFVPEAPLLKTDFLLVNYSMGYNYAPSLPSPVVVPNTHFWKKAANGAYVCGPELAYRDNDVFAAFENSISEEGFDTKVLPDGWLLVKTGPRADTRRFGSGECGACPIAQLQIFAISPNGKMQKALDIYDQVRGSSDITFSKDWQRATFYKKPDRDKAWDADNYCLAGHTYRKCGSSENAAPPKPPVVPGLRTEN